MTKFNRLRKGLCDMGIKIIKETPVMDGKFIYTLMICEYIGEKIPYDIIYSFLGELPKSQNPQKYSFYKRIYNNLKKRISGLINTTNHEKEIKDYQSVLNEIDKLMEEQK